MNGRRRNRLLTNLPIRTFKKVQDSGLLAFVLAYSGGTVEQSAPPLGGKRILVSLLSRALVKEPDTYGIKIERATFAGEIIEDKKKK